MSRSGSPWSAGSTRTSRSLSRSQYSSLSDEGDERDEGIDVNTNYYDNHRTVSLPLRGHADAAHASVMELRQMMDERTQSPFGPSGGSDNMLGGGGGARGSGLGRDQSRGRSDSFFSVGGDSGDYVVEQNNGAPVHGNTMDDAPAGASGNHPMGTPTAISLRSRSGVNRFITIDDNALHHSKSGLNLAKSFSMARSIAPQEAEEDEALKNRFIAPSSVTMTPKTREMRIAGQGGGGAMHGAVHDYDEMVEAIERLKRMAKFESHDYDQPSSEFEEVMRRERPQYDYVRQEMWKWLLAALIGITMGIISFLVDWGISGLITAKYRATKKYIDPDKASFAAPFFVYMSFTWGFAFVAAALVSYVEPLAAGSGIPELKTYLNGVHLKGLLQIKTLVAKLVGIMFSISSGLIAGKEGPFVHGGGVVGGGIAALGSQTLRFSLPRSWGGYFRNDADHRDFVAIGTAAGVATAFAAPIGGVLFTVEEGASWYSTNILWRGFLATSLGVLSLHWLVELREHPKQWAQTHFGVHRDFALYSDDHAYYGQVFYYYGWEIPFFLILGALGGLAGSLFIFVNVRITKLRQKYIPVKSPHRRVLEVVFVATITAFLFFIITYFSACAPVPDGVLEGDVTPAEESFEHADEGFLSGAGESFEDGREDFFPQLWCKEGSYNIFGQLFFVPLAEALRIIFHLGETLPGGYTFPIETLLVFFGVVYFLMTWTYGVGAATGLFVPSLAVGAALGRAYGRLIAVIFSGITINLQTYAILGAAASLGGATRMTISITVLVMETTGALQLLIPIMLTVFMSKIVGDYFNLGIYDTHIKIRGAPLLTEANLELEQTIVTDKLRARDLMAQDIVTFEPQMRVKDVLRMLRNYRHGAFPIKSEDNERRGGGAPGAGVHTCGVILRTQVLKMLQHRIGWYRKDKDEIRYPGTQNDRYRLQTMLSNIPTKVPPDPHDFPVHQRISDKEASDMMIDFTYFMNRHPMTIAEDVPLARAYHIFRQIGLRHLFVTKAQPAVVGVITRKDLVEETAQLALGEEAAKAYQKNRRGLPYVQYDAYHTEPSETSASENLEL